MNRVAVITGGEGGLARAIAAELANAGFEVLAPGRAELDVADAASVSAFFDRLEQIELLINNAGLCRDAAVAKMSLEDFDSVMEVNLKGAFRCSQAAARMMLRQRCGHIVNVGSYAALAGTPGQANYAAAKAGLIGLTQSMAQEFGGRNVRVNCVLPGFLETKMTQHLLADEARRERIMKAHALRRLNTLTDAARFIRFLHTMEHVSGQVFQLDSRLHRWG